MDKASVSLIAERMGWEDYFVSAGGNPEANDCYYNEGDLLAVDRGIDDWHLTDSGAFEVLVEMEIGLNKVNGMYQANYRFNGANNVTGTLGEQSPHEIVALAALAMIEEEG